MPKLSNLQRLLPILLLTALSLWACATAPASVAQPGNPVEDLIVAMRQARFEGDIGACVELGNQALQASPADTRILGMRARCLAELGRSLEAVADLRRIEEIGPAKAFVLDDVALAYLALGRPHDAVVAARRAVAMDASCEDAHFDLISALMAAGDQQEAIAAFEVFRASGLEDRIGVANNLSWELYLAGRYNDALGIAEGWLAANPTVVAKPDHIANAQGYAKVLDTVAHARAALRQSDDAVRTFLRAAGLSPELSQLYRELLAAQGFAPTPGVAGLEPALRTCLAGPEVCRLYVDVSRSGPRTAPL